jgi:hypothetical protein
MTASQAHLFRRFKPKRRNVSFRLAVIVLSCGGIRRNRIF